MHDGRRKYSLERIGRADLQLLLAEPISTLRSRVRPETQELSQGNSGAELRPYKNYPTNITVKTIRVFCTHNLPIYLQAVGSLHLSLIQEYSIIIDAWQRVTQRRQDKRNSFL